jgi:Domain of unknown function (DUF4397)
MWNPIGSVGRGLLTLLLVGSALAGLATFGRSPATAQEIETRVMWLHAGPSTGKVEVHINNDEVLDEFEYGDVSDWLDLEAGSDRVTITADRAGFNYAIFDAVYPVPAGNDYHAIITDVLIITNVVDRSPIPDRGARVRIVQASVDTPEVNVVATSDNTALASQLSYSRSSDYVEVPAGSFEVAVNVASTGDNALTQTVELEGDMVYDLVLMGTPGDDDKPLTITLLPDTTLERADSESTPST